MIIKIRVIIARQRGQSTSEVYLMRRNLAGAGAWATRPTWAAEAYLLIVNISHKNQSVHVTDVKNVYQKIYLIHVFCDLWFIAILCAYHANNKLPVHILYVLSICLPYRMQTDILKFVSSEIKPLKMLRVGSPVVIALKKINVHL